MHYFGALVLTVLGLVNELRSIELNNNNATNHWPRAKLDVFPQFVSGLGPGQKLILGKNNESLNITCKAVYQNPNGIEPSLDYDVDWKVPSHVKDKIQSNKIMAGQGKNIAWLSFDRLSERDAGDYTCNAVPSKSVGQTFLSITINLSVKSKPTFCGHQWFRCRSSHCIMERYLCDGKPDCEEGEDETASAGCTSNPCLGKVLCDGRCIPPEWCCDHRNCSGTYGLRPWPPETPEISYVQTAFYTVIGCAMAFMLIVTILVIAICRVQIKRAMNSRWTQQNRNNCPRRRNVPMPIYDLDVYLNRTVDNYSRGVSIMYNINSGVQFVGRPVEPPPYSEVIASPPREGPPPPYVSCENLIEQTSAPSRQSENPTVDQTDSTTLETSLSLPMQSSELRDDSSGFSGVVITSRSIPGPQVPTVSHISSTTAITDNTSNRAGHSLPQTFDLEYVETDALLSENANIKISSPKDTIRKPYLRCGLLRDRGKDQSFSKFWYYGGTDKNKDNSPLRSKDLSSADSENEGVFLDTDQQESRSETGREPIPSTSTNNTEQSITDKNKITIDKNNKRSNESSNDDQSSQIDKIIVPSNLDGNQLDTLSANSSQTRTTLNDTRANKTNESSTTMSTILVPPSDHQTEANNVEITANEPLVLPLRESFIGVQRNS